MLLLSFLLSFLNKLQTDVLHINKDKMMEQNKDTKRQRVKQSLEELKPKVKERHYCTNF